MPWFGVVNPEVELETLTACREEGVKQEGSFQFLVANIPQKIDFAVNEVGIVLKGDPAREVEWINRHGDEKLKEEWIPKLLEEIKAQRAEDFYFEDLFGVEEPKIPKAIARVWYGVEDIEAIVVSPYNNESLTKAQIFSRGIEAILEKEVPMVFFDRTGLHLFRELQRPSPTLEDPHAEVIAGAGSSHAAATL